MDKYEEARRKTKELAAQFGPDVADEATVITVNDSDYTVDVRLDNGGKYYDCQLRAIIGGEKSIDVLPKNGTRVLVCRIAEGEYYILAADEIDSYRITVGTSELKIKADGITVKRDTETLKKILDDLLDTILTIGAYKDTASLTQIKQRINNLLK